MGLLLATLLMTVPAVVLASHQFTDVPDSNIFHDEISAIAEAGITSGFGDGGFHPTTSVTRQAMAAFMSRGLGRAAWTIGDPPMTPALTVAEAADSSPPVAVRELTITVPGATNIEAATQVVYLMGRVVFVTRWDATCPCELMAFVRDMTDGSMSAAQYFTASPPAFSSVWDYRQSFDIDAMFVAAPGTRTYQLEVGLTRRQPPYEGYVWPAETWNLDATSSLTAMTFPFDATAVAE
jgi:hypothetical protein